MPAGLLLWTIFLYFFFRQWCKISRKMRRYFLQKISRCENFYVKISLYLSVFPKKILKLYLSKIIVFNVNQSFIENETHEICSNNLQMIVKKCDKTAKYVHWPIFFSQESSIFRDYESILFLQNPEMKSLSKELGFLP